MGFQHQPAIAEPFYGNFKILGACALADNPVHEFLVFFAELGREAVPYHVQARNLLARCMLRKIRRIRAEYFALDFAGFEVVAGINPFLHHFGHSTHKQVTPQQTEQFVVKWFQCIPLPVTDGFAKHFFFCGVQEFKKRERTKVQERDLTHRERKAGVQRNAKQRTSRDYGVLRRVFAKILERGQAAFCRLNFIEDNQGVFGVNLFPVIELNRGNNSLDVEIFREQITESALVFKVDINGLGKGGLAELLQKPGLSSLSSSTDYQRLAVLTHFPLSQLLHRKSFHNASFLPFYSKYIQKKRQTTKIS